MKRSLVGALAVLLLAGCAAAAPKTGYGHVLVRAAVTQYQPDSGTPCVPASSTEQVTITIDGTVQQVPLGEGKITYPDGKPAPGQQWCSLPFTVLIASDNASVLAQVGEASATVTTSKLYSTNGAILMMVAGQLIVV